MTPNVDRNVGNAFIPAGGGEGTWEQLENKEPVETNTHTYTLGPEISLLHVQSRKLLQPLMWLPAEKCLVQRCL